MTVVLFVHGVGGPTPDWEQPLLSHLATVGLDAEIRPVTLQYEELLRRRGLILRSAPPPERARRSRSRRGREAAKYERRRERLAGAVAGWPGVVGPPRLRVPNVLSGEALVRLPVLNMRQAGHYRHSAEVRDSVLDRLAGAISAAGEAPIIVAHSLGSVVALDALHARDIRVGLLVTVGSPLGIGRFWGSAWEDCADFPFDRLGSWLNVVNLRDPIPWQRGVSGRFPPAVDAYVDCGTTVVGPSGVHNPVLYTGSGPVLAAIEAHVAASLAAPSSR